MTKLGDALTLSQQISLAAGEECMRLQNPEIDVDHLFLALLVTDGAAGRRLRDLGASVEQARSAVVEVHAARVAGLGIVAPAVPPARVDPAAGRAVEWSPRALRIMRSLPSYADDLPLLRALLDDPGGFVSQLLGVLGVDESAARAATGPAGSPSADLAAAPGRGRSWRSVSHDGFAPAPPEEVLALVSDPARRLEWDSLAVASVQPLRDGRLEVTARTAADTDQRPDRRRRQSRTHERRVEQGPDHLEWETTWPDVRNGPVVRFGLRVEAVPGGSRLQLTTHWRRRPGLAGVLRTPLLPLVRFAMKQQLVHRAAGISRALR